MSLVEVKPKPGENKEETWPKKKAVKITLWPQTTH